MSLDRIEEIFLELGVELGVPLHPDKRGACKLRINDTMDIQLESDSTQENLRIGSFLCEITPGKFRENILRDALKSNGPFPVFGILSFSERNNQLALFAALKLSTLNGKTLADFLLQFIEKATQWRTAVETGQTSQLVTTSSKTADKPFGLK